VIAGASNIRIDRLCPFVPIDTFVVLIRPGITIRLRGASLTIHHSSTQSIVDEDNVKYDTLAIVAYEFCHLVMKRFNSVTCASPLLISPTSIKPSK
jgi:hypothetical protein